MDSKTLFGLSKAFEKLAKKEQAREGLSAGEHNVDATVTVKINGSISVGEDFPAKPTSSIPWKTAMALFVRYSGATGETAMNALVRAMSEAIQADEEAEKLILKSVDLEKAVKLVEKKLEDLPKKNKPGVVRTDLEIEEV